MRKTLMTVALTLVAGLLATTVAQAKAPEGWTEFRSDEYGFRMLLPAGATPAAKAWSDGWAGLYATAEGDEFFAITKKGAAVTRQDIEAFGVQVTGIPGKHWRLLRAAKNELGFKWFRTVRAVLGPVTVFARYGEGPKGPYLMVLKTTTARAKQFGWNYLWWGRSINVF